jgi:hypothetical protein
MIILLWIISIVLLAVWFVVTCSNLWIAVGGLFKKREKFVSFIPFVGGILGMIGVLLLPVTGARPFWWIPILLDLGCGLMLVGVVIEQIKKIFRCRKNSKKST